MPKPEYSILSTAALDENIIETARGNGFSIEVVPFIKTHSLLQSADKKNLNQLFQKPMPVVFTSVAAVEAVHDWYDGMGFSKIFSIGKHTADRAAQLFEKPIAATAPYADALAEKIIDSGEKEVVFFSGSLRRDVLPQMLQEAGIQMIEKKVYETVLTPEKISKTYDAVLFFSPSAVASFLSINSIAPSTQVVAIGHTTAEALHSKGFHAVHCSPLPSKQSVVETALQLLQTNKPT